MAAPPLTMTIVDGAAAVKVQSVSLTGAWCTSGTADPQCATTFAALPLANATLQVQ